MITTILQLESLASRLRHERRIAIDTESDSFYHYPERLCLIQISTAQQDILIDALVVRDLSSLAPLLADSAVEKVFHAAEYDIACLQRACPAIKKIWPLFDTMAAARILGYRELGLGALVGRLTGASLSKKWQRSDWGRRPLTRAQIHYAKMDTHYLLSIRDKLERELRSRDLMEEALEEFERLSKTSAAKDVFDPEGFRYIKGAGRLKPDALAVLKELYLYREKEARRTHLPPFKVLTNELLIALAEKLPKTAAELRSIRGFTPFLARRHYQSIMAITAYPERLPRVPPAPKPEQQLTFQEIRRYGRLKAWRKAAAQKRGVVPDVILSNETLKQLVLKRPSTLAELERANLLPPSKLRRYGKDIIKVIALKK